MFDHASAQDEMQKNSPTLPYDLIVVGAGVAGLNALFASTEYLSSDARVLLIDEKANAGGMWNTAYDYVRLHQPHPMFTVGNLKWDWNRPRDYLARRDEVRDHLSASLEPVAKAVNLETKFSRRVVSCKEIHDTEGFVAEVSCHPVDRPSDIATFRARRVIHAPGLNYRVAEPLALSSNNVVSVIPQDLRQTLQDHPGTDVYVVGGGKTAMDTVLAVLEQDPARTVTMINGRGTNFLNRTRFLPTGLKRWTSGALVSSLFRDIALSFDGTNGEATVGFFRENFSTEPDAANGVFLYGLQSEEELARISSGLTRRLPGYLADIRDTDAGPEMQLRSGATETVRRGSIFVNCTGSFFRAEMQQEHLPCISPHGTLVSINARDGFHFLTSVSGFFLVHLLFRDMLRGRGFYTMDHEKLFRQNRNAWVGASAAQAYLNQVIAVQSLPMMLLDRCGLDLDRWYPLPRRMAGLYRMKARAAEDIAHCTHALDVVAQRYDVHAAPLD
ncbi:FAD-dependent oxidoreductase [uncultured Roseobacter sp.]|uniref:FAD-dependent oxidoreductase n=1 Tax=uncultured Roseobacter sp. TaxID=114847 RepID=UPI0026386ED4|nr:FAD-dependent oxidoreductase [uncultured Roseobacter sp.]